MPPGGSRRNNNNGHDSPHTQAPPFPGIPRQPRFPPASITFKYAGILAILERFPEVSLKKVLLSHTMLARSLLSAHVKLEQVYPEKSVDEKTYKVQHCIASFAHSEDGVLLEFTTTAPPSWKLLAETSAFYDCEVEGKIRAWQKEDEDATIASQKMGCNGPIYFGE